MSSSSDDCPELSSCTISVQHCSESNDVSVIQHSTSLLELPTQSHSRKSSNTSWMTEVDDEENFQQNELGEEPVFVPPENIEWSEKDSESSTIKSSQTLDNVPKITHTPPSAPSVFKKCAPNGSLAVYVGTRTLTTDGDYMDPLKGVVVFDKEFLQQNVSENFQIWGQITLTFRYGREIDEVLGLRFCNDAIISFKQLWPPLPENSEDDKQLTPLQELLLERINSSASSASIISLPFTLCPLPMGIRAFPSPPSVLLVPAKPFEGSPIGTRYDLRIYASERPEERPPIHNTIRIVLRAVQTLPQEISLNPFVSSESRPTMLSRGKIRLQCALNKNVIRYGENVEINLTVKNNSRITIRRVSISLIQQVDVCMFKTGTFTNVVGHIEDRIYFVPGVTYQNRYAITPKKGPIRQWLAVEEAFGKDPILAPSTCTDELEPIEGTGSQKQKGWNRSRNLFAIVISYFVKVKLRLGGMAHFHSLKVPFVLLPPLNPDDPDSYPRPSLAVTEINFNPQQNTVTSPKESENDVFLPSDKSVQIDKSNTASHGEHRFSSGDDARDENTSDSDKRYY